MSLPPAIARKFRSKLFRKWRRSARLGRDLRGRFPATGGARRIRIVFKAGFWQHVGFDRDDDLLTLAFNEREDFANDIRFRHYQFALPVMAYLAARAGPQIRGIGELGDGSVAHTRNMVFSSNYPEATLVPDPDFFNTGGYQSYREPGLLQTPWRARNPEILWRGASTGYAEPYDGPLDLNHPLAIQRVRFCRDLQSVPGIDAKIYFVVPPLKPETDEDILRKAGLIGGTFPTTEWCDRQFAFDIDGNANAWSNFFIRLLVGCCVLKVDSVRGYKQWYYDRLIPWTHFVPVSADLSDLHERIDRCRSHLNECEEIARAGQTMALSMTFESEIADTIQRINAQLS